MANTKQRKSTTAPGKYGDFTIAQRDGKFKVYKLGKFCCPFDTLGEAEKYITEHQHRRIVLTPAT